MIPYYFLGPLFGSSYSCLIIVSFFQSCVNGEVFSIMCERRDLSVRWLAIGGKESGERNGGGRQTVVIVISTCCMEVILNKIEEQLSALDRQLESISIRSWWSWSLDPLTRLSKKLNIRVSLLACMLLLFSCIMCYVLFGPSLLSWVFRVKSCDVTGIWCAASIPSSIRWAFFRITQKRSTLSGSDVCGLFTLSIIYWIVFGVLYIVDVAFPSLSY